ncbi:hypothetical protein FD755_000213 [Muntiacus reevesi]|uniref:Transducer of regulated CREB activity C-terminal domain-containing protein n=1 Tax=Muntiacus reevesi TaxID=9886 RepID=A0A5J5MXZ2_MUNRE|nr:hypothetical protein FD755_000213 [Muntiacus reevesi]
MASPSNPLKFSEKITLQKQCEAKEMAAFEEAPELRLAYRRSSQCGGSLPNFFHSPLDSPRSTGNHRLVEQVQRDPRRMSPAFFSPPPASSYMMNPSPLDSYPGLVPARVLLIHRDGFLDGEMDSKVPSIEENLLDGKHLLKPWDAKKLSSSSRPRSCEDPGINIWSPEKPATVPVLLPAMNTGGSLPDVTTLHFPPPLATPWTQRRQPWGPGLGPGYDVPGLHSPLSHPSLQSSISNPNLQASLSAPQLQGSHSHCSRLPACLLLGPPFTACHLPGSPLTQFPGPLHLLSASSLVLPSPPPSHRHPRLTQLLPPGPSPATTMSQQQLPKQFSPTTSPTFGPPTSDCPHIHYSPPSLVLPTQPPTPQPLQRPGLPSQTCSVWPSGCQPLGRQLQCGTLYPPSPSEHGQQSYHRSMIQHGEPINQLVQNLAGFSEGPGFLGDERPVSGPQDPHALNHQNITHYCSGPGLSAGFEVPAAGLGLEEELCLEPLGLEGLSMLSDPCALLPDPAVEDLFRSDRLQ